jgi:hypothetical protein
MARAVDWSPLETWGPVPSAHGAAAGTTAQ